MNRTLLTTADGSHTISIPELNLTYHSRWGAIQESMHVFIQAGLHLSGQRKPGAVSIFEMGFGTGLNALLTAIESAKLSLPVHYTAIEPFPLTAEEISQLNYTDRLGHAALFNAIHEGGWEENKTIHQHFILRKERTTLADFEPQQAFDLIYYDAFAPAAQPELWDLQAFQKLFSMLEPGGHLVTYCSKGDVKRAMTAAGFTVTKLPGPPGKREMLRAEKPLL
ncbi:MAG TPA: tRNA (5-methylaminomethyl-2-thiouridine)(34)-methyltransferase MnmD [Flavisolibacter sp.]|nr:tRNA (5-methylaminomethyl-2-thiouridine)(34)-methyltransferase MnmD [Flavisolibacter sp.]